ncbi:hypothetical protein BS78_K136300 [Paspalum vaginatum]|uniref:Uncharacterized protein n=1 Tax=Paspalum vaginatum TaxID=158149 RepID=A0A9W8CEK8_9POAL|nr:hypothetical protein BS78_K136300 [Paspalum vaginatum]
MAADEMASRGTHWVKGEEAVDGVALPVATGSGDVADRSGSDGANAGARRPPAGGCRLLHPSTTTARRCIPCRFGRRASMRIRPLGPTAAGERIRPPLHRRAGHLAGSFPSPSTFAGPHEKHSSPLHQRPHCPASQCDKHSQQVQARTIPSLICKK